MKSGLHTPFGDTPPPVKAVYIKAPHAYEFASQTIQPGASMEEIVNSYLAPPGEDGWMVAGILPPKPDGSYEVLLQRLNVIRPDVRPRPGPSLFVPK